MTNRRKSRHEDHLPRLRRRLELLGVVGATAGGNARPSRLLARSRGDRSSEPARHAHGRARGDLVVVAFEQRDASGGDAVRVRVHGSHPWADSRGHTRERHENYSPRTRDPAVARRTRCGSIRYPRRRLRHGSLGGVPCEDESLGGSHADRRGPRRRDARWIGAEGASVMVEVIFPRNGEPWTPAEEEWLLRIYEEIEQEPKLVFWAGAWRKHPMYHAAKRLGRTPTTVSQRRREVLKCRARRH